MYFCGVKTIFATRKLNTRRHTHGFFMKILKYSLWAIAFVFINLNVGMAQKASEFKKTGEKYFKNSRWQDALNSLNQYQQEKPGDADVLIKLGICSYYLHDTDKARQYFEYVLQKDAKNITPELYFFSARLLHGQQDYNKAVVFYKLFLKLAGNDHYLRKNVIDNIKRCNSAMSLTANEDVALVENMGDRVNSIGDEFAPLPSVNHSNRLYYSAARVDNSGGLRNDEGLDDSEKGAWCSDMYYTSLSNAGWESGTELGNLLNTTRNETALGFAAKGKILYYSRGYTLYSGEMLVDTAGKNDEYAITPPVFSGAIKMEEGDQSPYFFNDTTMIFASRRKGGLGGLDLFFSTYNGINWGEAQNLGAGINTNYDETTPYLAPDGLTLYFSSNHTGTVGGLDVFKSIFDRKKQKWSTPQNMGVGINSPGDDAYFKLAKDGKTAFFSSDRLKSMGERDIYIAYFKTEQAESMESENVKFGAVSGTIEEKHIETNPENAEILLLRPLYYETDKDLLSIENQKTIKTFVEYAKNYPELTVLVQAHTDETGPLKFDLYYGIKRAEIIAKTLIDRGIPAGRIFLRSAGFQYPVAKTIIGQEESKTGIQLNKRVELSFSSLQPKLPIEVEQKQPQIIESMLAEGAEHYQDLQEGLTYKVEVSATRQIFNNDNLAMFDDVLIESTATTGSYQYTAGLLKSYQKALVLRSELVKQGFTDAFITANINGIRISRVEASSLVKKYPDLALFLKN
jgi:outer membrane protein OmpA-like peptidoglycan-associated protein/tetratricopeptide (TPR) repeat protein